MPKYAYQCEQCGFRDVRFKRFTDIDTPEYCPNHNLVKLKRVFTARFTIAMNYNRYDPQNDIYRVATDNGTQADQMEMIRGDAAYWDETDAAASRKMKPKDDRSFEEVLLDSELPIAAMYGQNGIEKWRQETLKEDPLETFDPIAEMQMEAEGVAA